MYQAKIEDTDGKTWLREITVGHMAVARRLARIYCQQNGYRLLYVERLPE